MNPEFSFKIRRIYLPYVIVLFSCVLVYSLVNWALTMRAASVFEERTVDNYIPYAVGALATLLFLYRRINLLRVVGYRGDNAFVLILILTALSIGFSVNNAQKYLRVMSGKFVQLQSIGEIHSNNDGRFYTIKEFYVDKTYPITYFHLSYTGKYANLKFDYYVLFPLYKSKVDTAKVCAWIGLHYDEEQTNPKNSDTEIALKNEFIAQSERKYAKEKFWPYDYFIRQENSNEHKIFLRTLNDYNRRTDLPVLTIPQNSYQEIVLERRFWFLVMLGITLAFTFIFVFISDLKNEVLIVADKTKTI